MEKKKDDQQQSFDLNIIKKKIRGWRKFKQAFERI